MKYARAQGLSYEDLWDMKELMDKKGGFELHMGVSDLFFVSPLLPSLSLRVGHV